ncbi:hypothetical protein ACHAXT_004857 [Thalassiosira profunda]
MSEQITQRTTTVVTVGNPDPNLTRTESDEWKYVEVHFHRFERLSSVRNAKVESPQFSCLGRKWTLELYPGGCYTAADGYVSIFLTHQSTGSIGIEYKIRVQNGDGKQIASHHEEDEEFESDVDDDDVDISGEIDDFAKRSKILQALINGALVIEVRMRVIEARDTPMPPFIPDNPLCQNVLQRFNDEETANVLFELGGENELGRGARKKAKISPVQFYAHCFILHDSAPTLAELAKSAKDMSPVQITGVKPEIFHHMLRYAYGGEVPEVEMKANAKDLIDAADKYGVVGLKLQAEACYASSVELTVDNVLDNLLYADSKNCALLKEVVMEFLVQNGEDILGNVSFENVPGSMMTDLLTAVRERRRAATMSATLELTGRATALEVSSF